MYNQNPPPFPRPGGMAPGYGGPPPFAGGTPPVVTWFRVFAGLMALLYLVVMGMGIVLVVVGGSAAQGMNPEGLEPAILGVIYSVLGLVFGIAYAVGLFLPRKPWGWVAGIVLIAIGMTSICCLPATIPLLIFWLKPEAKAYFGRI